MTQPQPSPEAQRLYEDAKTLIIAGDTASAKPILITILEKEKMAPAYNDLGLIFMKEGDPDSALGCFEEAVNTDPTLHEGYANAGDLFIQENLGLQALDCYIRAIQAHPEHIPYRDKFIAIAANFQFKMFLPNVKAVLLDCMKRPGIDLSGIDRTWISILQTDPAFSKVIKLVGLNDEKAFAKGMSKIKDLSGLADPLFLAGLHRIRFFNMEWETLLTNLRRHLLENISNTALIGTENDTLALAQALAIYAFKTDYVFNATDSETNSIEPLKTKVEQDKAGQYETALLASYLPLYTLSNADGLSKNPPQSLKPLWEQQLIEPLRLQDIAKSIPVLVEIENKVSTEVQAQYEESPYPRWTDYAKRPYSEAIEGIYRGTSARMMVAGTGTGREAIELATVNPDADILAVDLSRTSLSYGIDRARILGIKNITFKQADILGLGVLGNNQFDFIASSGVIHHMEDPFAGWQVLTNLLKPGGVLRLGLYSRIAHAPLIRAQEKIRAHGLGSAAEDIRTFRKNARKWLDKKDYATVTNVIDFYATAECRDMFFHVQETRYDTLEIKDCLEKLGLEFLGFNLPKKTLYQYAKENPEDPQGLDLKRWDAFEQKHPRTFAAMYNFWSRKRH